MAAGRIGPRQVQSFRGPTTMQRITVKVPATTANMGPGFDCLGMALDIWNTVTVGPGATGIEITGEGADILPRGPSNLIVRCFRTVFETLGRPVPEVKITCHNEIPVSRGLGSSSAGIVGGLMIANEICDRQLSQDQLLELAVEIEGHPDNVAPALLGGCQISVQDGGRLVTSRIPLPEGLKTVLFVPDVPMSTNQARGVLPPTVDRADAVYNIGRVAMLVRALATGDLQHLKVATQDRLHQPARQEIFFPMKNIFRGAIDGGALGVFLSGSGPSVLALTKDKEFTIGYEMADAAAKSGIGGEIKVTRPSEFGAHVEQQ